MNKTLEQKSLLSLTLRVEWPYACVGMLDEQSVYNMTPRGAYMGSNAYDMIPRGGIYGA
jgi:hypothetical protein